MCPPLVTNLSLLYYIKLLHTLSSFASLPLKASEFMTLVLLFILSLLPIIISFSWGQVVENAFASLFFFKDFILFIFRQREGEKHQCVVASHTPLPGDLA